MKIAVLAGIGCLPGALFGAAIGVGLGFAWTTLFKTSDFEGYSGRLVFFSFMPVGALLGGIAGGIVFARAG